MATRKAKPTETATEHYRQMLAVLKQFRVVVGNVKEHYRDVERVTGVGGAQLWALWAVSAQPGLKVSDLARELAIHQSTASNLLDRLEKQGYLIRQREAGDQRKVSITLTKAGKAVVARAPGPAIGVLQHALLELDNPTLSALQKNLDALIDAIGVKRTAGAGTPLATVMSDRKQP